MFRLQIKGTNKRLIVNWIRAIEKDIKNHKFYCIESKYPGRFGISSVNKARLLVMYDIFHISSNDYQEGSSHYFAVYKGLLEESEEKMMNYLKTMKSLLEIN